MTRYLLLFALLLSCSSKGDKPAAKTDEVEPKASGTCEAEVVALRAWLTTLAKEGGHVGPRPETPDMDIAVTDAALPEILHSVIWLHLSPTMVMVEGSPVSVEVGEKLTTFLDALKAEFAAEGSAPPPLVVAVDSKTPWKRLVATTEATSAAGYTEVGFAFRATTPKPTLSAPPASSMNKEIMAFVKKMETPVDPAARQLELSAPGTLVGPDFVKSASVDCPQLEAVFASYAEQSPKDRVPHLTKGAADAVEACACAADIALLKEIFWYVLGLAAPSNIKVAAIGLNSAAAKKTTLAAPADATWQEMHMKIVELASADELPNLELKIE